MHWRISRFRIRASGRRRLTAAYTIVALLLVGARVAAAQRPERAWTVSVAAGVAVQPDRQSGHLALWGGHVAALVSARLTSAIGLRVEGFQSSFGTSEDHVHGPCDPDLPFEQCHAPAGPVRVRALTLALTGSPRERGGYGTLGGGAYRLGAHPLKEGDTRLGVYAGFGRRVGSSWPKLGLEVQVHWVPGLTLGGAWSAPVRLGLTF